MSVSRHHADWLSLVKTSGPFVSLPVLIRVFPQGLDPRDAERAKLIRLAYEEWQENPSLAGKQRAWILHVLTQALEYPAELLTEGQALPPGLTATVAEQGETLQPDFALLSPKNHEQAGKTQLLIKIYPPDQPLEKPVTGKHWKASPATRMTELLHAADISLGLVTNGEQWMLVFAPRGETSGFTSWFASLWIDEPIMLRAFLSLLSVRRLIGVAASDTLLALLKESAQDQQEVTSQLGEQVRDAVEVLIQAFDRLDQDSGRVMLKGMDEKTLYDAALTVMMRLVFLFSAEERGLLHLGKSRYDDNYAVSTLREQLQEVADQYGEEVLERRCDGWARLLATFRAVHGGVNHQDLMLPAYGGSLFDPDRYPFLEGRPRESRWHSKPAEPLEISNRVVLHLLRSLQMLRVKVPGGCAAEALRVSFEGLNIEQIGHVYEGLLDHTAVRAREVVLGLAASRKKPVAAITLAELEQLQAEDEAKLIETLEELTDKQAKSLRKALASDSEAEDFHKVLIAAGQDQKLAERIMGFRGLLRQDSFERPVIVLPGGIYVGQGSARRSTGTHYTPRSLTEPIVQHTLEPLVYKGPAEGLAKEQWQLRSPKEILDLKVCDMAMGSGAFLVQACRYLSERLVEAWEDLEKAHPGEVLVTPEGQFSEGEPSERLIPKDSVERLAIARRMVADRCLYGVDINPMAVEMAKLSIWLITVDKSRPFNFLDHALKCGDSLLGLDDFEQLEKFSLRPGAGKQIAFSTMNLWRHIEEAKTKREALEAMASDSAEQISAKILLYDEAEESVSKLKAAADVLTSLELKALRGYSYEEDREATADRLMYFWSKGTQELRAYANEQLQSSTTLHWPLAFPEVIQRGGFDAFVGNPPFLGGRNITSIKGRRYNDALLRMFESPGTSADLCSYFLKRSWKLLRHPGYTGFVTVESIASGKTRLNGLESLCSEHAKIFRAKIAIPWPGDPNREVAIVHFCDSSYMGRIFCNDLEVPSITSSLRPATSIDWSPQQLRANLQVCFQGITVNGDGFIFSAAQASEVLLYDSKYRSVLTPYLTGIDLNRLPVPAPTQFVINFHNMSEEQAGQYSILYEHLHETIREKRVGITSRKDVQEKWWSLQRVAPELEMAMAGKERVLARTRYGINHCLTFVSPNCLFSDGILVFAFSTFAHFAILQSNIHFLWALEYGSPRAGGLRYKIKPCFECFPLPHLLSDQLDLIGQRCFESRQTLLQERGEGLNDLYNRVHSPEENAEDILRLRNLHVEMDYAVTAAYGWNNLNLGHGFQETKQGVRFSISDSARRIILERLLVLNHERYKSDSLVGNTQKGRAKAPKVKSTAAQGELL